MKKYLSLFILLLSLLVTNVFAAQAFLVKKIELQGLQRISAATVYNYLPIKPGQVLQAEKTGAIIKSLYQTGFFDHISLARSGNTLIIKVVERPIIGQLKVTGNSVIATDKLTPVMKSLGIVEGRVYDRAMLDKIKQGLLNQYYELGRYNARVDTTVTPQSRGRVLVKITISEGLVAKVEKINIIGNHSFNEKILDKQLALTTPGLFTFFTQSDRYSQEKLETSLEGLRNFYMDHGYIKFAIISAQVAITPDRKSVYLTIVEDEGAQYKVSGFDVAGETILPHADIVKMIPIQTGDIFSRKVVMDAEKSINDTLGNKGYIFSNITLEPKIDDAKKTVFLTFVVKPGKRTYVRHIYFTDNTKTNDVVLRREIEQMEAAVVSTKRLDDAKHRLKMRSYIKEIDMSVVPVPNRDDLVDVNYKVTEQNAAEATFSLGYSQIDHLLLGAGFNQKNFLGTGKTVGLNATHSRLQTFYGLSYTDPFYTQDGISRTLSLSASKFNPGASNITSGYTMDQYAFGVSYGIPLGQEEGLLNQVNLGYGYQNTLVDLHNPANISNQVYDFINNHGHHFQQIDLTMGYTRDSRDKVIFPTSGMVQSLGVNLYLPVTGQSLRYYTAAYNTKWYHPIVGNFIAAARSDLAYGGSLNGSASNYPFFKNFYAGGIDTVRGYLGNTLGPRDSTGSASGGNFLADASFAVIFPNPLPDTLRTSVYLDAGNVYDTYDNRKYAGTASGPIRMSGGVQADWLTPLGMMVSVSLATPIHPRPQDQRESFQFSLGANFG